MQENPQSRRNIIKAIDHETTFDFTKFFYFLIAKETKASTACKTQVLALNSIPSIPSIGQRSQELPIPSTEIKQLASSSLLQDEIFLALVNQTKNQPSLWLQQDTASKTTKPTSTLEPARTTSRRISLDKLAQK